MKSNQKCEVNVGFAKEEEEDESTRSWKPVGDLKKSEEKDEFEYLEGGWGWVVVLASAYCFGILYGMVGNYALIFNKFEVVYNETENHVLYAG